jgi:hypothetical protein
MSLKIIKLETKTQGRQPFEAFTRVTWRGTTRVNPGLKLMGISFDTADGRIIRLKLDPESASDLRDSLDEYLTDYERSQSASLQRKALHMNTIELKADAKELLEYIEQLRADLADAPLEIRKLALDFIDISPELVRFEFGVTSGSVVTALLKPTQRLLDLGLAIRTGNFDPQLFRRLPAIKHSHKYNQPFDPFDDRDPCARILKLAGERELKIRANIEDAAERVAKAFCSDCPFRPDQASHHKSLLYALFICEDGTIGLTIFDTDDTAIINLGKDLAKGLVENINHYIQLLE